MGKEIEDYLTATAHEERMYEHYKSIEEENYQLKRQIEALLKMSNQERHAFKKKWRKR